MLGNRTLRKPLALFGVIVWGLVIAFPMTGAHAAPRHLAYQEGVAPIGDEDPLFLGCGDGVIDPSEQCDDGNVIGGDGCSAECQTEIPILINDELIHLGDGLGTCPATVWENSGTFFEAPFTLVTAPTADATLVVRNGDIDWHDNRIEINGHFIGNLPSQGTACFWQDTMFPVPGNALLAGDNLLTVTDAENNGAYDDIALGRMTLYVTEGGVCGDGVVDPNEECDDGNSVSGDGCDDACHLEIVCDAGDSYSAECQGGLTYILLDGGGSSHPYDDPLNYSWTTNCSGGVFDDDTSPTPVLVVDTFADCGVECSVTLTVDDGFGGSASCSTTVSIVNDCVRSHGYWKNHEKRWPVESLTLGNVSYDQDELLAILGGPGASATRPRRHAANGLVPLARQLIAAKLNLENGAPGTDELFDVIATADELIGELVVPPIGDGGLHPSETSSLTALLDKYNNGELTGGPPSCDAGEDEDDSGDNDRHAWQSPQRRNVQR